MKQPFMRNALPEIFDAADMKYNQWIKERGQLVPKNYDKLIPMVKHSLYRDGISVGNAYMLASEPPLVQYELLEDALTMPFSRFVYHANLRKIRGADLPKAVRNFYHVFDGLTEEAIEKLHGLEPIEYYIITSISLLPIGIIDAYYEKKLGAEKLVLLAACQSRAREFLDAAITMSLTDFIAHLFNLRIKI